MCNEECRPLSPWLNVLAEVGDRPGRVRGYPHCLIRFQLPQSARLRVLDRRWHSQVCAALKDGDREPCQNIANTNLFFVVWRKSWQPVRALIGSERRWPSWPIPCSRKRVARCTHPDGAYKPGSDPPSNLLWTLGESKSFFRCHLMSNSKQS